jgi:hypothetical protein
VFEVVVQDEVDVDVEVVGVIGKVLECLRELEGLLLLQEYLVREC